MAKKTYTATFRRDVYIKHLRRIQRYTTAVNDIYERTNMELLKIAMQTGYTGASSLFRFSDYPLANNQANEVIAKFRNDFRSLVKGGLESEWDRCNIDNNAFVTDFLKRVGAKGNFEKFFPSYYKTNEEALKAFIRRRSDNLNLSDRIWKLGKVHIQNIEDAVSVALKQGTSAAQLSRDVRKELLEPNRLFRRVRDKAGELKLSLPARRYHPGAGVYRSSYKNAMRLTRTVINNSYREAEQERWRQLDFIVGFEVKRTQFIQFDCPLCDAMAGIYPKTFVFTGWHPQCYSDDTEVMTDKGWKLFKDLNGERIMSLNPVTRELEYVNYITYIERNHEGDMVHFFNRSLDMLVTPDHPMVYLNKTSGKIMDNKIAANYSKGNGGLLRTCEYSGVDIEKMSIGNHVIDFDLFSEFMGYYLSDGCFITTRKNQMFLAKSREKKPEDYAVIQQLLEKLPFKFTPVKNGFYMRDCCLYEYVKQFGKSADKYIPAEIKNASKRQIEIFLDAFNLCDGSIRKSKEFVGNRGAICKSKKPERVYFTTSDQMAADLGELLLKKGNRPSYRLEYTGGVEQEFRNGTYVTNHNVWIIRECYSKSATVFEKKTIPYSGKVYDVELERNHIMYVRRNGKCVWGSNCLCYTIPVLCSDEEFWESIEKGKEIKEHVEGVPGGYKRWIAANSERIIAAEKRGTLPWFLKDNEFRKYLKD